MSNSCGAGLVGALLTSSLSHQREAAIALVKWSIGALRHLQALKERLRHWAELVAMVTATF